MASVAPLPYPAAAPVPTTAEVRDTLRSFFTDQHDGIDAVYLFGSFARGTARPHSDVDVAVLFTETPPSTLDHPAFVLDSDLQELMHREVQIVTLNTASPDLAFRILRDGILLVEPDRSHRIAFEVRALNEYRRALPSLHRSWKLRPTHQLEELLSFIQVVKQRLG